MADSANASFNRPESTSEQRPIPLRSELGSGWIACTTDSILAIKDNLWDLLITMPRPQDAHAKEKLWPTVKSPKGDSVKATQRDLRRFRTLEGIVRRLAVSSPTVDECEEAGVSSSSDSNVIQQRPRAVLSHRQSRMSPVSGRKTNDVVPDDEGAHVLTDAAEHIVEPVTWAALAYSGFMWWASAGEQRLSDEAEEQALDKSLIADLIPAAPSMHHREPFVQPILQRGLSHSSIAAVKQGAMDDSVTSLTAPTLAMVGVATAGASGEASIEKERAQTELAIITFFRRLTSAILSTLAEVVAASEECTEQRNISALQTGSDDGEGESDRLLTYEGDGEYGGDTNPPPSVRVDSETLVAMGLDVWSNADADFVRQLVSAYFGREAEVEGKGMELCGLRVC